MYLILILTKLTQIPMPRKPEKKIFFQLPDDACAK